MPLKNITQQYITLLKQSLVGELYIENEYHITRAIASLIYQKVTYLDFYAIDRTDFMFQGLKRQKANGNTFVFRQMGSGTPLVELRNLTELAHTMIGMKRMDNIQHCVETVLKDNVAGDLIETGVWRGGATIFMRGLLAAHGITDRVVWVADSFQGVPPPTYPQDANFDLSAKVYPFLTVSRKEVEELFERYGLLDDQVKFLEGWFKDTLASAPIEALSILRLDGDLFESTMDAINPLYAKVTMGGFVIVDDYYSCPPCKRAIDEFRAANGISDEMFKIDDQSVFWRKR